MQQVTINIVSGDFFYLYNDEGFLGVQVEDRSMMMATLEEQKAKMLQENQNTTFKYCNKSDDSEEVASIIGKCLEQDAIRNAKDESQKPNSRMAAENLPGHTPAMLSGARVPEKAQTKISEAAEELARGGITK